jgi:hypothetical protein
MQPDVVVMSINKKKVKSATLYSGSKMLQWLKGEIKVVVSSTRTSPSREGFDGLMPQNTGS